MPRTRTDRKTFLLKKIDESIGIEQAGEDGSEENVPVFKCTCLEKCSQYEVDKDCAICRKAYKDCAYVNPSVKITITTPTGWHNDTAKVHISVEDTVKTGNFIIRKVQATDGENQFR